MIPKEWRQSPGSNFQEIVGPDSRDQGVGAAGALMFCPDGVELGGAVGRDDLLDVPRVGQVEIGESLVTRR